MIPVISIPVLNRYDLLDQSLDLIDFPVNEILIINNGREPYTPKRKDLNIRVLNLPSNLGMAASWNLTIKLYPHVDFWIFSSADIFWLPGSLEKLYRASGESRMVSTTESFSCFSLGSNVVREVGLFDEYFYPIYFEDSDYADRVTLSSFKYGKQMLFLHHKLIEVQAPHGSGQTIKSDENFKRINDETYEKNKKYYELKKSQNHKILGQWNIDVRRSQEWLQ